MIAIECIKPSTYDIVAFIEQMQHVPRGYPLDFRIVSNYGVTQVTINQDAKFLAERYSEFSSLVLGMKHVIANNNSIEETAIGILGEITERIDGDMTCTFDYKGEQE